MKLSRQYSVDKMNNLSKANTYTKIFKDHIKEESKKKSVTMIIPKKSIVNNNNDFNRKHSENLMDYKDSFPLPPNDIESSNTNKSPELNKVIMKLPPENTKYPSERISEEKE